MKKLILIGGDLASGKSTYSNILKDKFNILVINKDRLKEILGDHILVNNRDENKKLSVISFDLMKYILNQNNNVLVLESNFKSYEMEQLNTITKNLGYDVLSLVFKGDIKVLHERFNKRLNENRHYVHKSQDFTNIKDFEITLNELRTVNYIGKVINVDSTTFDYQNDMFLLERIRKFIYENN